jgi:tubulin---tyrosine ligase
MVRIVCTSPMHRNEPENSFSCRLLSYIALSDRVLQRYIAKPLLLGRRKFHIRAYVLAVSALRVYLYKDCLALCAGQPYRSNDTTNLAAHITNTAYQVSNDPSFQEHQNVLRWSTDDIVPLLIRDGTCATAEDAQKAILDVVDQMGRIVSELFRAYQSEFGVFSPIEGCFEHYGIDFLVDDGWHVHLLEVNPGPDFKQTGSKLESVIENLMGATIDVALLPESIGRNCPNYDKVCLVYEQKRQTSLLR